MTERLPESALAPAAPQQHAIALRINGEQHRMEVEPWVTLLDLLRDKLDLTGTKKGCDHGQCGACTVLVNGKRINSCLTLAVMRDGCEVTTVEGLAALGGLPDPATADAGAGETLHPLQQAFINHDAFQCGYCTPGQLCSAVGLISEGNASTVDEVRELMSGNICRCGAYPQIVQAVCEIALGSQAGRIKRTGKRPIVIGTVPA